MKLQRRDLLGMGGAAAMAVALPAWAQSGHAQHGGYERLREPGAVSRPPLADQQMVFDSPAPKAERPGRWLARAALPLPRSEMAWAAVLGQRMHLVGGYGEQRVDRPYHHVYDPKADAWRVATPLPLGANHVGVTVLDDRLYAIGGFVEQNRKPHAQCFVYTEQANRWEPIAPLPRACGSVACVALDGRLHGIGGAVGDSFADKRSIDWHLVYDPKSDRWAQAAPLPTARDHVAALPHAGLIHVIGGRVNSFLTNSNLHHAYNPKKDAWEPRNPLPTARSGHGAAIIEGRIFVMGGEGSNRVFGQNEAYDTTSDTWAQFAPMPTPRHGLGAVAIGRTIYVAGGGAVMGGGIQTSIHEAFTLD